MFQGIAIAEGLVFHPGDTLLVRLPSDLSQEEMEQVVKVFEEEVPGVKIVLLSADLDIMKVTARDDR